MGSNGHPDRDPPGGEAAQAPDRGRRARKALLAVFAAGALAWVAWPGTSTAPVLGGRAQPPSDPRHPPSPFADGPAAAGPDREAAATPAAAATARASAPSPRGAMSPAAYAQAIDRFEDLLADEPHPRGNAQLVRLARALDAGLSHQLARDGIDPGDAVLLKADLLDVLEPDAQRRGEQFIGWYRRFQRIAGDAPQAADEPRYSAIIAAWQAQPSEDRDAGELQEQLEALRLGATAPKALNGQ
jgi:pyruvate/2-oxoglutarate dehydrogenase complex dihydrolipoamide acyltransferase (E2) component